MPTQCNNEKNNLKNKNTHALVFLQVTWRRIQKDAAFQTDT